MQVTGNFFWGQNAAWQNTKTQINPLLAKAQNAIERQSETKESTAISEEMEAKIRQNNEDAKIDPNDKIMRKLMAELVRCEEEFYGGLFNAHRDLQDLVDKKDAYTSVLDGTADYDRLLSNVLMNSEGSEGRFGVVDFNSYLKSGGHLQKKRTEHRGL